MLRRTACLVGFALAFGTLASVSAQERVVDYAIETVTLFDPTGAVVDRKRREELPAIPAEGLSVERLKLGLVRVNVSGHPYIFNHSHLKIAGTPLPAGTKNGCNKVRTTTGERRNSNIGMGLGGCE